MLRDKSFDVRVDKNNSKFEFVQIERLPLYMYSYHSNTHLGTNDADKSQFRLF
jgi:hypothetical protein